MQALTQEKIWRDLDEVRRQATTVEEGRARAMEKKLTSRSIAQARDLNTQQNRMKAATQKQANLAIRRSQRTAKLPKGLSRSVLSMESDSVAPYYSVVNLLRIVIHYSRRSVSQYTKRSGSLHFSVVNRYV